MLSALVREAEGADPGDASQTFWSLQSKNKLQGFFYFGVAQEKTKTGRLKRFVFVFTA